MLCHLPSVGSTMSQAPCSLDPCSVCGPLPHVTLDRTVARSSHFSRPDLEQVPWGAGAAKVASSPRGSERDEGPQPHLEAPGFCQQRLCVGMQIWSLQPEGCDPEPAMCRPLSSWPISCVLGAWPRTTPRPCHQPLPVPRGRAGLPDLPHGKGFWPHSFTCCGTPGPWCGEPGGRCLGLYLCGHRQPCPRRPWSLSSSFPFPKHPEAVGSSMCL